MPAQALFFGSLDILVDLAGLRPDAWARARVDFDLPDVKAENGAVASGWRGWITSQAVRHGLDPSAVLEVWTEHLDALARATGAAPRAGAVSTLRAARAAGQRVALCDTADPAEVDLVLERLAPMLSVDDFDWIGDAMSVARPRPAADIHQAALDALRLLPDEVLTVEASPEGAAAARDAGLRVVGFPVSEAAADFPEGLVVTDRLEPRMLDPRHHRPPALDWRGRSG